MPTKKNKVYLFFKHMLCGSYKKFLEKVGKSKDKEIVNGILKDLL